MAYVRLSIAHPRRGEEKRLEELMRKLADAAAAQQGCTASYLLEASDGTGDIARIAIYDDQASADAAANTAHIMALRSELHLIVDAGHLERSFATM